MCNLEPETSLVLAFLALLFVSVDKGGLKGGSLLE